MYLFKCGQYYIPGQQGIHMHLLTFFFSVWSLLATLSGSYASKIFTILQIFVFFANTKIKNIFRWLYYDLFIRNTIQYSAYIYILIANASDIYRFIEDKIQLKRIFSSMLYTISKASNHSTKLKALYIINS